MWVNFRGRLAIGKDERSDAYASPGAEYSGFGIFRPVFNTRFRQLVTKIRQPAFRGNGLLDHGARAGVALREALTRILAVDKPLDKPATADTRGNTRGPRAAAVEGGPAGPGLGDRPSDSAAADAAARAVAGAAAVDQSRRRAPRQGGRGGQADPRLRTGPDRLERPPVPRAIDGRRDAHTRSDRVGGLPAHRGAVEGRRVPPPGGPQLV